MAEIDPQNSDASPGLQPRARGVTFRSVSIGTIVAILVCAIVPYNDYVVGNTFLVGSYLPLSVVLLLFVLVVLINAPLHRFSPRRAISTPELAVILTMCLVAGALPGQGLLRQYIPSLVMPFFLGQTRPEFWTAFIKLDWPAWMFPVESIRDGRTSRIVQDFYGRTPEGEAIPFGAWVRPLLGWGIFAGGLMTSLVSLAYLFRVQWSANERLAFPLAQLQLSLIEAPARGHALNALFRSRVFWLTTAAVVALHSLTALNAYFPRYVQAVPLGFDFRVLLSEGNWRLLPEDIKYAKIFFTFLGVAYFIQSRTAFSMWSIWVILQFVTMQTRVLGSDILPPAWRDQHLAACVVYTLGVIWLGRRYWVAVARSFGNLDRSLAEARWATVGFVAGTAVMAGWLLIVGVSLWMTLLIIGVVYLAHVSTARIVAETGMPIIRTMPVMQQIFQNIPPSAMSGKDVFMAGHTTANAIFFNRESMMGLAQHGLVINEGAESVPRESFKLAGVIAWTLVIGFLVASASSLTCYYSYSGQLGSGEPMLENKHGLEVNPLENVVKPMESWAAGRFPEPSHTPWLHFATGATVTGALQLLTWRLSWWPFVPVGYLAAGAMFTQQVWFSVMLGWLAKVGILRFGGASMYQRMRPIFVGLIFGEGFAAAIWLLVNIALSVAGMDYMPVRILPT